MQNNNGAPSGFSDGPLLRFRGSRCRSKNSACTPVVVSGNTFSSNRGSTVSWPLQALLPPPPPPQQHSLIDSISASWLCVCLWLRVASSVVSLAEAAVQFTNNVLTNEQGVSCDSGGLTQCQIDMNGNQWLTTSAVNYFALKGSFLGSVSGVYFGAWTGWPGAMLWR